MSEQSQNGEVKTLSSMADTKNPINPASPKSRELSDQRHDEAEIIDVDVVLLTNYVRRHHMVAFQEIQKRVRKLTVLLSVPMEPDREWEADWGGLDVVVQKNRMFTRKWKHSTGFSAVSYTHLTLPTILLV